MRDAFQPNGCTEVKKEMSKVIARGAVVVHDRAMEPHACIFCQRTSNEIPLVVLEYRGTTYHICSQHLPVLIHNPAEFADMLPGVEKLKGPERVL